MECSVGAESRRNYLACYQVFLIATSFNFSPWAWPNHRRRWMPGKPWILLRKPLSIAVNGAVWIKSLVRWPAIMRTQLQDTCAHADTHPSSPNGARAPWHSWFLIDSVSVKDLYPQTLKRGFQKKRTITIIWGYWMNEDLSFVNSRKKNLVLKIFQVSMWN